MTTAYTSLLGLALPVQGELSGTWGDTVNNSITSLLDTSVAGTTNVSTDTDVTLTTTTGAANTARQAILLFSGARTALRTVTAPAQSKIYTVINATTGGFSVKLVGVGPTTGVTIVAGESAVCAWNGSDFIKISNAGGSASFVNLTASGTVTFTGLTASQAVFTNASDELVSNAITGTGNVVMSASPTLTGTISAAAATLSGNLTLSGGTANGVTYLNGSKVVTSGSALTFNGTNLATTASNFDLNPASSAPNISLREGNTYRAYLEGNSSGLVFGIGASATEQMRLTSTGLGIGTSSPSQKLTVAGTQRIQKEGAGYEAAMLSFSTLSETGAIYRFGMASGGSFAIGRSDTAVTNLTLDTSGNLGLGVTPSAWSVFKGFDINSSTNPAAISTGGTLAITSNGYYNGAAWIYKNTAVATLYQQQSGQHQWYNAASGTAGNAITFTQAMTLDASSNLIVGDTATQYSAKIYANGSIAARNGGVDGTFADAFVAGYTSNYTEKNLIQTAVSSGGTLSGFRFKASDGGGSSATTTVLDLTRTQTIFYTGGSERARIDSSGNLLMAKTANDDTTAGFRYNAANKYLSLVRDENPALVVNRLTSDGNVQEFWRSGTLVGSVSVTTVLTTYNTTSDYRLKNVIGAVSNSGERLDALEPIEYEWKTDGSRTRGFLAHKFQEVYAGSVTGTKDAVDADGKPIYQAMQASSSEVIADLVAEIQSLRKRLADAGL